MKPCKEAPVVFMREVLVGGIRVEAVGMQRRGISDIFWK